MNQYPSDIGFSPAVKAIQSEKGSRDSYAKMEQKGGWKTTVTPELQSFISQLDMFYLGTASAAGAALYSVPRWCARFPESHRR